MKRRTSLTTVTGIAASTAFPRFAIGLPGKSANSKLTIAVIGSGGWIAQRILSAHGGQVGIADPATPLRRREGAPEIRLRVDALGQ